MNKLIINQVTSFNYIFKFINIKIRKIYLTTLLKIFVFILLGMFFNSCSNTTTQNQNQDLEVPIKLKEFKTLSINADISIQSPENNLEANCDFSFYTKDTLTATINGPFGITVVKSYSTKDTAIIYSLLQNIVYYGKPTQENIFKATKIYLGFDDLLNILISEIPGGLGGFRFNSTNTNGDNLLKRIENKRGLEFIVNDKNSLLLKQYQNKGIDGSTKLNVYFDDYKIINDMDFAHKLKIEIPQENSIIQFEINNIEINPTLPTDCKINYSKNAKLINLDIIK